MKLLDDTKGKEDRIEVIRDAGFMDRFLARLRGRKADYLIPNEFRDGRILDIGCGLYPLFLLSTSFREKYGIDQVVDGQSHSQWQNGAIHFSSYNLEENTTMPFDNDFFDVVTMLAVFEHITPEKVIVQLTEVHRVLKPGGVFIMTTPAAWTDGLLRFMARMKLVSPLEFEEHKDVYTPSKIVSICEKAGFLSKTIKTGYFEMFMNIWVTAFK